MSTDPNSNSEPSRARVSLRFPTNLIVGLDMLSESLVGSPTRTALMEEAVTAYLAKHGIDVNSKKVQAAARELERSLAPAKKR